MDAPDFLLKEIDTLSKISVVRLKLILAQVAKGCVGESIDVKTTSATSLPVSRNFITVFARMQYSQYEKVDNLVSKSNLTSGDVKGAIAGIDFVLKSGCKYNVDEETLAMELQQLGLPNGVYIYIYIYVCACVHVVVFIFVRLVSLRCAAEHCEAFGKAYSSTKDALQRHMRSETLKCTFVVFA